MKPKIKPGSKLAALLDDDPPQPVVSRTAAVQQYLKKPKAGAKLAALMDDDEPTPEVKKAKLIMPLPAVVSMKQLPAAPEAFFNVQTRGGVRITIIDRIGADWKDLICYNWDMKVTMHLKVEDLMPIEHVRSAIEFIRTQLRSEK